MKISESSRRRCLVGISKVLVLVPAALFCISLIAAWGASGAEHAAQGWQANDWYRLMNFAVLAAALFLLLRKPVSTGLRSRVEGIKEQLADLELRKTAAEKKLAEYNEKLSQLEGEADRIVAEYIKQGQEAKSRILQEAEAAVEKLETQARKNIAHEFERAKQSLQEEIFEKSLGKAEAMIKSKITAKDQDRLVDEYLDKVVA